MKSWNNKKISENGVKISINFTKALINAAINTNYDLSEELL